MALTSITFKGVELDIQYDYMPYVEDTFNEQGNPEILTVEQVFHKDVDITELVEEHLDNIGKYILKDIKW